VRADDSDLHLIRTRHFVHAIPQLDGHAEPAPYDAPTVLTDLADVHSELIRLDLRSKVRLAFGGGVRLQDLGPAAEAGADAVDVGRAILDAPLLDLRLRVCSKYAD
jgi:nicotinate-nucleotide pyrophosphorylase